MNLSNENKLDLALADLVRVAQSEDTRQEEFRQPIEAVWQLTQQVVGGANKALDALAPCMAVEHPGRAGYVALCCGGLVESGGWSDVALSALIGRLAILLPECEQFWALLQAAAGKEPMDELAAGKISADELVMRYIVEIREQSPMIAGAWSALEMFGRAGVAFLSRSTRGRQDARANPSFVGPVYRLCHFHTWAGWMATLLDLLDGEEMLVIHPAFEKGYRVRATGVVDNFQLHTLLADALLGDPQQGWLPGNRPDPRVVAMAHGQLGVEEDAGLVGKGLFNLVQWHGLLPVGTIRTDADASHHWIWGEGGMDEIGSFEGQRVILLGPMPYERTWNPQPSFSGLNSTLEVLEILPASVVQSTLNRMASSAVHYVTQQGQ